MHAGAPRRVVEPMDWPGAVFRGGLRVCWVEVTKNKQTNKKQKTKTKTVSCVLSVAPLGAINLVLTHTQTAVSHTFERNGNVKVFLSAVQHEVELDFEFEAAIVTAPL